MDKTQTAIIHLISGPRNISTALMYSFAQRPDCKVIDEPFYARYLHLTGLGHPARDETLAYQSTNVQTILSRIDSQVETHRELFIKNMGQHLIDLDWSFVLKYRNAFLIRDPKKLIASFAEVWPDAIMRDIGLDRQSAIFDFIRQETGETPIVLDSEEVLKDPHVVLSKFCERLGIPFFKEMLQWPMGEIHDPVPWADHWYGSVMKSTGFQRPKLVERTLPDRYRPLYEEALPYYEKLKTHAITT